MPSPAFLCAICLDASEAHAAAASTLRCGHAFGARCIADWCARAPPRPCGPPAAAGPPCPLCRRGISGVDRARICIAAARLVTTHVSDVTCDED
jgi:hypothetical protein